MSRVRRLAAPILGTVAGLALAPAPAGAAVTISAHPSLRPAFDRSVTDYVVSCESGAPVRVHVHASGGDRVSVGGGKAHGGTFERKLSREPDRAFAIRLRAGGRTTSHHVRCLPSDFPRWTFDAHGPAQAQWYIIDPTGGNPRGYIAIFDTNGVPVWWRHEATYGPWDGKLLPDGNLAWMRFYDDHFGVRNRGYEVRRLDGSLVREIKTVGSPTDTHDFQPMPNGDYLAITYRRRCCANLTKYGGPAHAEVFDGEIQELTPRGKLVWRWNSHGHIPLSWTTGDARHETGWWYDLMRYTPKRPPAENAYDLVHFNAVQPDGDGVIVSSRHTDSVYRIDRATGRIDWKLGGTYVPGKSLTVAGKEHPEPLFGGQHDARLWKDGTLTVYDNGSWHGRPPAADRFRIDPVAHTATLLERLTNPEIVYSVAIGSARKLTGGNWVVNWGNRPVATEQTPDGTIVRRFTFLDDYWAYRAVPVEPGQLSAAALRHGMNRMVARRARGR
ncbi:MAG: arylsulfotransferase family protein [Thermoleophilaceae bacterium]